MPRVVELLLANRFASSAPYRFVCACVSVCVLVRVWSAGELCGPARVSSAPFVGFASISLAVAVPLNNRLFVRLNQVVRNFNLLETGRTSALSYSLPFRPHAFLRIRPFVIMMPFCLSSASRQHSSRRYCSQLYYARTVYRLAILILATNEKRTARGSPEVRSTIVRTCRVPS